MSAEVGTLGRWLIAYVRDPDCLPDQALLGLLLELPAPVFLRLVAQATLPDPAGEMIDVAAALTREAGR